MKGKISGKKWFERFPHPVVMLFGILMLTMVMSYLLPAGQYDRVLVEGRERVVPGSYHIIGSTPLSFMDLFRAIPQGFRTASDIIFIVLASGIMFGILEKSRMIENAVGTVVKHLGQGRRYFLIVIMTYLYGFLGVVVGYENNIAMVPIAAVTSLAIGGDLVLAAGIAVGGITVGFGLSPINPYTVGTGHKIAELPLFSGALLRGFLCFAALSFTAWFNVRYFRKISIRPERGLGIGLDTAGLKLSRPIEDYSLTRNNLVIMSIFSVGILVMLYGVFVHHWYINDISAIFMIIAISSGLAAGMNGKTMSKTALKSVSVVAPGAFMVGLATSIKAAMEMGQISDTVAYQLSAPLARLPLYASALAMSGVQSVINLVIPSGSGQALATLPIMVPLGDLIGLTRQTTVLAFQIGDGVTNLFNPTLGGLIAMLSLCRVPFDRWLRFIFPLAGIVLLTSWLWLLFSVYIGWGPA